MACNLALIPGKNATDAIIFVRQLQEKMMENSEKEYIYFVHLEKVRD